EPVVPDREEADRVAIANMRPETELPRFVRFEGEVDVRLQIRARESANHVHATAQLCIGGGSPEPLPGRLHPGHEVHAACVRVVLDAGAPLGDVAGAVKAEPARPTAV